MTKAVRVKLPYEPYPHQALAHQARLENRFLVLVWHRRAGKTVFSILELLLAALENKRPRARYAYIAPLLKQCKSVVWDYLQLFARVIPGCEVNQSELRIDLPNGAQVRLFGADNPDSLRGLYFDGVVFDEVADMPPNIWGEIVRPALADRQGWAIFIGTPKGVNLFSELYYRACKTPGEKDYAPGWKGILLRWDDTNAVPAAEVEQARREMTEAQFAQEWDCDFAAAVDDVMLKLGDVLTAQHRNAAHGEFINAAKILAVDVARYGGDRSVILKRQGVVCFQPEVRVGAAAMDLMTLAGQVAITIESWKPDAVFVDIGGMGAGVVDRLRQLRFGIIEVDFGARAIDAARFENKRIEMWWEMAEWVRSVGNLPSGQDIVGDLTAPRYTFRNQRGRLQLESKDDMRKRGMKSPDIADALAMTFAAPVAPKDLLLQTVQGHHMPQRMSQAQHDYDPFAGEE